MTMRSPPSGALTTRGPRTATMAASTTSAAAAPSNADRHPRVTPAAITIVTASTVSTALAAKTASAMAMVALLMAPESAPSCSLEAGLQQVELGCNVGGREGYEHDGKLIDAGFRVLVDHLGAEWVHVRAHGHLESRSATPDLVQLGVEPGERGGDLAGQAAERGANPARCVPRG